MESIEQYRIEYYAAKNKLRLKLSTKRVLELQIPAVIRWKYTDLRETIIQNQELYVIVYLMSPFQSPPSFPGIPLYPPDSGGSGQ